MKSHPDHGTASKVVRKPQEWLRVNFYQLGEMRAYYIGPEKVGESPTCYKAPRFMGKTREWLALPVPVGCRPQLCVAFTTQDNGGVGPLSHSRGALYIQVPKELLADETNSNSKSKWAGLSPPPRCQGQLQPQPECLTCDHHGPTPHEESE